MNRTNLFSLFLMMIVCMQSAFAATAVRCLKVHRSKEKRTQSLANPSDANYQKLLQEYEATHGKLDPTSARSHLSFVEHAVKTGDPVLLGYLAGHGFKQYFTQHLHGNTNLLLVALQNRKPQNLLFLIRQSKDLKPVLAEKVFWSMMERWNQYLLTDADLFAIFDVIHSRGVFPKTFDANIEPFANMIGFIPYFLKQDPPRFEAALKNLLRYGVDLNSQDFKNKTRFLDHVLSTGGEKGVTLVKMLLKYNFDFTKADEKKQTPFAMVLQYNIEAARYLLNKGLRLREHGSSVFALMNLLYNKGEREKIPDFLLELQKTGFNFNEKDDSQLTAIEKLAKSESTNQIPLLLPYIQLSKLSKPAYVTNAYISSGDIATLRSLHEQGLKLGGLDENGISPLAAAVRKGHKEMIDYLLSQGASFKGDRSNESIWLLANQVPGMKSYLLSLNADMTQVDSSGKNLLHHMATGRLRDDDPVPVVELIQKGVDYNLRDAEGKSPFDMARERGAKSLIKKLEDAIYTSAIEKVHKREPIQLSDEDLRILITRTLSKNDETYNSKGLTDLSIEEISTAVKAIENESTWSGLNLSSFLFGHIKRRDTGLGLMKGFFAQETSYRPTSALELFSKTLGIDNRLMQNNKYSEKSLGDFFQVALGLQAISKKPLFLNAKMDPQLLQNKQLATFGSYLSRIRIVAMMSSVTAEKILSDLPNISIEHLNDIEKSRLEPIIVESFKNLFSDPSLNFTYEQFMSLYGKWGDLEPVMILTARYKQADYWRPLIPLLVEVLKSSLAGEFSEYKFGRKNPKTAKQLGDMTDGQISSWQKPRAQVALAVKPELEHQAFRDLLSIVENELAPLAVVSPQRSQDGLIQEILGMKMSPKLILQQVAAQKNLTPAQLAQSLFSEFSHQLLTEQDPATVRKSIDWLRTLAIQEPSIIREGQIERFHQVLLKLRTSIKTSFTPSLKAPILLTVVSHDPKFMLTLGDLVPATSCINYRTGEKIGNLMGYVIDANVQGMASFVVTDANFKNSADYEKVQLAINQKSLQATRFDGNRRIAYFKLASGEEIETQFLGYGFLRNALKLGHRNDHTPAIYLEKDYFQNHLYLNQMLAQHKRLLQQIAQEGGFQINGAITIAGSKSPDGIYSDVLDRTVKGDHLVNIPTE